MAYKNKKVVVAMSGGVDSSVAAFLLKKEGYDVIGVFMRLFPGSEKSEMSARKVCDNLAIKYYPINLSGKFKKEVVDYFISDYSSGLTPNPCVKCNKVIKFRELLRIRKELGVDYLATGHYVKSEKYKVKSEKYIYKLFRGEDKEKDQSYFLYNLTQAQLKQILFPLGKYKKAGIRKIAEDAKLPYIKKESQDVCFLHKEGKIIPHNDYLKENIILSKGPIKTAAGNIIGEHQGLPLYTVGQRRGVEIGGTGPYWVIKRDYKTNTLYVTDNPEDPSLFSKEFTATRLNWISGHEPRLPFRCETVIRYRHKAIDCLITKLDSKNKYLITIKNAARAVTAGQSAVFYKKDRVIGGGIIDKNI